MNKLSSLSSRTWRTSLSWTLKYCNSSFDSWQVLLKPPTGLELVIAAVDLETGFHQREPRGRVTLEASIHWGQLESKRRRPWRSHRKSHRKNSWEWLHPPYVLESLLSSLEKGFCFSRDGEHTVSQQTIPSRQFLIEDNPYV